MKWMPSASGHTRLNSACISISDCRIRLLRLNVRSETIFQRLAAACAGLALDALNSLGRAGVSAHELFHPAAGAGGRLEALEEANQALRVVTGRDEVFHGLRVGLIFLGA